jgi:phosphatidylglycerol:prolipoprotein diacylglycerol transferase
MYPTLFKIGFLEVHTYGVCVAIAFILGLKMLVSYAGKIGVTAAKTETLVLWTFAAAIVGARLAYVAISYSEFAGNFWGIFKLWEGGLVFSGGFVAGAAAVIIYASRNKIPFWKLGDVFAVVLPLAQAIGRIGCFFAGCCYGKPCAHGSALCVAFPENSLAPAGIPMIPAQLIAAALLFAIFMVLRFLYARKKFDGIIVALYLILYSIKRLFLESLRGDFRGTQVFGLTLTQILAIITLCVGIVIMGVLVYGYKKKAVENVR